MTLALAVVCCLSGSAQERLFNSASVQSPVINNDGTVTFNLFAPKAVKVEVTGDFLPEGQNVTAMKEVHLLIILHLTFYSFLKILWVHSHVPYIHNMNCVRGLSIIMNNLKSIHYYTTPIQMPSICQQ